MTDTAQLQGKATIKTEPYDEHGYAKGAWGCFDFGHAISHLKVGSDKKVQRKGWNGKNMYVYVERSSGFGNEDNLPMLMIYNANGYRESWSPTSADALANDWQYFPGMMKDEHSVAGK